MIETGDWAVPAEGALVERRHRTVETDSRALYSPCLHYRYLLERRWDEAAPLLLYIMLNPSTATEAMNDPTIARCERRARRLGYGGFIACNLFAWRETDPAQLKKVPEPIGPANDAILLATAREADLVLCAWGVHGAHLGRGGEVASMLREAGVALHHLGLTQEGHPRHPLYLPYARTPETWRP